MTSDDLLAPAVVAVVVLALIVLAVVIRRERARSRAALEATRAEAAQLRERVDSLARQVRAQEPAQRPDDEFVITEMGSEVPEEQRLPEPRIEGRLFVDLVVRESVVKAAALSHGVRRALAPETRNRIRFAMKQEVKRSRKARRIEIRDLRREMAARRAAEKSSGGRVNDSEEGAA